MLERCRMGGTAIRPTAIGPEGYAAGGILRVPPKCQNRSRIEGATQTQPRTTAKERKVISMYFGHLSTKGVHTD